jgi:tetratricopeptide (TPR) repeat protein
VDPLTQQLAFDFATVTGRQLQVVARTSGTDTLRAAARVQEIFVQAVQLEENPATLKDAIALYETILLERQDHAPACINLGTIHYNQRDFAMAEELYRRATLADPGYALAFFDLGNVLDEMQRLEEAIDAYSEAIKLVPQYADAHYNLALAFERQGERRRALRHWMAYLRLDPVGPWAAHAKGQARKILGMEKLRIVSRSGRRISA